MIEFKPDQIRVDLVELKSVTTAGGGSISVVDPNRSTAKKEVYTRIPVPMAVARQFKERHKTSKYINPVWTAVVYYETLVIALERHPLGAAGSATMTDEDGNVHIWTPECQRNIDSIVRTVINQGNRKWYFDGRYVYTFTDDEAMAAIQGDHLSSDGRFRAIEVEALPLHFVNDGEKLIVGDRTCVAYIAGNGQFAITPPIWKDVRTVGRKQTQQDNNDDEEEVTYPFDNLNEHLNVNLNFALRAAKDLSEHWGLDAIEAVNLPQLMLNLKTVNLPSVPKDVKSTYDCGMSFTHAFAWLMGYQRRVSSLDELLAVRGLLKYLTQKGLYYGRMFNHTAVYRAGMGDENVPLLSKEQAREAVKNLSTSEILDRIAARRELAKQRKSGSSERAVGNVVGGLMTETE